MVSLSTKFVGGLFFLQRRFCSKEAKSVKKWYKMKIIAKICKFFTLFCDYIYTTVALSELLCYICNRGTGLCGPKRDFFCEQGSEIAG